ncbi:MAG: DUF3868 domain-containing protein [Prevotellaceae bacterium]|nr:DUF3868 domain-containing protein [Candidatus Minthosoma equi]
MKKIFTIMLLAAISALPALSATDGEGIQTSHVQVTRDENKVIVTMNIILDQINLKRNQQVFVTPYLESTDHKTVASFPSVLLNGRNMQYVYERSGMSRKMKASHDQIAQVVRRKNGTEQTLSYTESIDIMPWMDGQELSFHLAIDSCGCGVIAGSDQSELMQLMLTPKLRKLYTSFIIPAVTEAPVAIHEGKARVQFEVDRTELHAVPYVCKNGQRIDNRAQLQIICDSINYALRDENVEIANINICGYASPESPYDHNDFLATNRSRSLAEYIGQRYNLPKERCTYSSVPENWAEFREQVIAANDITEKQRQDLLELIDKPTYGSADFDAKERALKTDPRYAKLYKEKILPVWFPELRCTKFAISTRLKPTSDEQLARIIKTSPELLSLNQMFRVARLYPEGSAEFNETFSIALRFYTDDPVANLNAAVAAIKAGNFDQAAKYLEKAGDSPEAENARGVVAANNNDMEAALRHFNAAGSLREAALNKSLIKE